MKVLALNGSPRMKSSSTYHILSPFLEGMQAAGAETDLIHVRQLDLKPCLGCYTCWARTPGVCIHGDAMTEALATYQQADMVVYGTPLYHFSMSGIMKTFIDRLLPRHEPWLIPHPNVAGMTGHPGRRPGPSRMFLVSPCGFPEFENFDALVATFKQMARMAGMTYVGDILRPYAEPLSRRSLQHLFTSYYDLVRQAGEQVARDGRISAALQAELRRDLFPGGKQQAYQLAEAFWTQQMDRFKVPEALRHTAPLLAEDRDRIPVEAIKDLTKQPLTFYDAIAGMATRFNAGAAGDMVADIQFRGAGEEPGDYFLHIEDGNCTFHEGAATSPRLTIHTPSEVWLAISRGEQEGAHAFMQGHYRAEGDITVLLKLNELFGTV